MPGVCPIARAAETVAAPAQILKPRTTNVQNNPMHPKGGAGRGRDGGVNTGVGGGDVSVFPAPIADSPTGSRATESRAFRPVDPGFRCSVRLSRKRTKKEHILFVFGNCAWLHAEDNAPITGVLAFECIPDLNCSRGFCRFVAKNGYPGISPDTVGIFYVL